VNPSGDRPFTLYLRVRYAECDAQKVVFNSRYAEYVDVAVTEFVRALGYGEPAATGELEYQLVRQTLEWKRPARFDQVLELTVETARLGTTSFTLTTTFRLAEDPAVLATAETVYVMVGVESLTKQPLPPDFRAALEGGARGIIVDQAGFRQPVQPR
jgi:acyl-CoA thioester hydrolase